MFRYSFIIDSLLKAIGHKYIRRVPKGVTKTGATKYMYFYAGQEGHSKGIGHESELVTGASFAFGEHGKTRYHAHITKVDGDKITVKYDDGAKKGTEDTMTKRQFQALVHGEHATGIKEAQAKSEKQLKDFQAGKEKGVKVKQSTLDRLAQRVANLKDLVSHMDKPAPIEAPWMSERERRVFDGQNRLFTLLENKEITEALLKDRTHSRILGDMLQNVVTSIFKYKDISQIPKADLKTLINANKLIYKTGDPNKLETATITLSQLWQKLPFAQQEKNEKVGRLDLIFADLKKQTPEQKKKRDIHIDAVKQAQDAMITTSPDLAKLIYGNMIFTQLANKEGLNIKASGFFSTGTPAQTLHNVTTKLETLSHSADVIYMDTEDFVEQHADTFKDMPEKARTYFQTQWIKGVAIHEMAHRFSKSLLEQNNGMAFRNDLQKFFNKYSRKRPTTSILNRPIQEFTQFERNASYLNYYILKAPLYNSTSKEVFGTLHQNGKSTKDHIHISDINFEALGQSIILKSDGITCDIEVPLNNGDTFSLSISSNFLSSINQRSSSLPTTYAHENIEECFSEMMVAVCNPTYKDEPMRTEILALVNKYKGELGA